MREMLLAIVIVLVLSTAALAGEKGERVAIQANVGEMLRVEDFAGLEQLAETYRSEECRTPSGVWCLPSFYSGVAAFQLGYPKDMEADWVRAAESLDRWIEAFPYSPTPYVAKAAAITHRAWEYRGNGWINEVADDDLQQFRKRGLEATAILMDNRELGSRDPEWYVVAADALTAVRANKESFLEIMGEGLDRYQSYDPLYFAVADYLTPKWYGSPEELEAFARESLRQTRNTRGYELYARIYWASGKYDGYRYAFQGPEVSWPDMVKGMNEVLRQYPVQWNIQNFAFFACLKGDLDTAKRYLEMVREPILRSVWKSDPDIYGGCRQVVGLEPPDTWPTQ